MQGQYLKGLYIKHICPQLLGSLVYGSGWPVLRFKCRGIQMLSYPRIRDREAESLGFSSLLYVT